MWFRYVGTSMHPTFREGDVLWVEPVAAPAVGDVILYRPPGGPAVVHRVRAVAPGGRLITQGDASAGPDAAPVEPAQVVGRVQGVHRGGRGVVPAVLRRWLGPPYRALGRSRRLRALLRRLLPGELRVLRFGDDAGHEVVRYVYRGRVVARYFPRSGRLQTRAPWALVIDPAADHLSG